MREPKIACVVTVRLTEDLAGGLNAVLDEYRRRSLPGVPVRKGDVIRQATLRGLAAMRADLDEAEGA